MAAPVVRAEDLDRATREEYGEDALATSDQEAESALLARHLFAPPTRLSPSGARAGLELAPHRRALDAWLRMLAQDVPGWKGVGLAEIATTDGARAFLPPALPVVSGASEADHLAVYRAMALVQLGLVRHGLVAPRRPLLQALYADNVLSATYLLLAGRFVTRAWRAAWPGLEDTFARANAHGYARRLRIGAQDVAPDSVANELLALLPGPWPGARPPRHDIAAALHAVDALDTALTGPALADTVLAEARRLRETLRRERLGCPPLPFLYGVLRPDWILRDLARDEVAENAWREGPAALRLLNMARAREGATMTTPTTASAPQGLRARLLAKLRGPEVGATPAYGALRDAEPATVTAPQAPPTDDDAHARYDELDANGDWRVGAVEVIVEEAAGGPMEAWERLARAHAAALQRVRARFAALRTEARWRHGQPDGSELDLGAVVTAMTDVAAGSTPDPRIHARFERAAEPIAVLVLADLSGSMAGDLLTHQTTALALLAEGLATLDTPHALLGFGNTSPTRCVLQRIKGFDERWDDASHKRLANVRAAGASRLGAYVRHATELLATRPEPRRVLVLLSDGRPEDRDGYRGRTGERDTAMAVHQARARGIHVQCTSMDRHEDADGYLTRIFGRGRYLRVRDPSLLPERLPELVRGYVR